MVKYKSHNIDRDCFIIYFDDDGVEVSLANEIIWNPGYPGTERTILAELANIHGPLGMIGVPHLQWKLGTIDSETLDRAKPYLTKVPKYVLVECMITANGARLLFKDIQRIKSDLQKIQ